ETYTLSLHDALPISMRSSHASTTCSRSISPRPCSSPVWAATSTTAASMAASAAGLAYSWDISPRWQLEDDPERASEVEVRFVAETPERTRVELEHRHLDRHGDGWESLREGV